MSRFFFSLSLHLIIIYIFFNVLTLDDLFWNPDNWSKERKEIDKLLHVLETIKSSSATRCQKPVPGGTL